MIDAPLPLSRVGKPTTNPLRQHHPSACIFGLWRRCPASHVGRPNAARVSEASVSEVTSFDALPPYATASGSALLSLSYWVTSNLFLTYMSNRKGVVLSHH